MFVQTGVSVFVAAHHLWRNLAVKLKCLLTFWNTPLFGSHDSDSHHQPGNKIWHHLYATSLFHSRGTLLQELWCVHICKYSCLFSSIRYFIPHCTHTNATSFCWVSSVLVSTLTNGLLRLSTEPQEPPLMMAFTIRTLPWLKPGMNNYMGPPPIEQPKESRDVVYPAT